MNSINRRFTVGDKVVFKGKKDFNVYEICKIEWDMYGTYLYLSKNKRYYFTYNSQTQIELYNPLFHTDYKYEFKVCDKIVLKSNEVTLYLSRNEVYIIERIENNLIYIKDKGNYSFDRFNLYIPEFFPNVIRKDLEYEENINKKKEMKLQIPFVITNIETNYENIYRIQNTLEKNFKFKGNILYHQDKGAFIKSIALFVENITNTSWCGIQYYSTYKDEKYQEIDCADFLNMFEQTCFSCTYWKENKNLVNYKYLEPRDKNNKENKFIMKTVICPNCVQSDFRPRLKTYVQCDFFEPKENNNKGENIKMKQVVLEIPNQNPEVTYKWLKEQKACESAIDWFVEKFGNKAKYDDVLELAKKERSDSDWLVSHKNLLVKKEDNIEYVHIDNINSNKIYMAKDLNNNINELVYNTGDYKYRWVNIINKVMTSLIFLNLERAIENMINNENIIYEFDTFKEVVKWLNTLDL